MDAIFYYILSVGIKSKMECLWAVGWLLVIFCSPLTSVRSYVKRISYIYCLILVVCVA